MAVGISKQQGYLEEWSIPLESIKKEYNENNKWLVEHLRAIADRIEQQNPTIMKSSLAVGQYGAYLEFQVSLNPVKITPGRP